MNAEIEKEIDKCVLALRDGGFVIFPSEIGWSIGCMANDDENIKAVLECQDYEIPAILIEAPGRLRKFVKEIPDATWDLIEFTQKPLHVTIQNILSFPSEIYKNMEEVYFRVTKDDFSISLINKIGKPLFAAALFDKTHPTKVNSVLNKNCYVVNLRASAKSTSDNLVMMRLLDGGKFEIIKK
jgi:L-threonylcarbamoyladenylate synthase